MRFIAALAGFAAAAAVYAAEAPLGFDNARHLLNRTSFAAGPADIEAFAGLTREQKRHLRQVKAGTLKGPVVSLEARFTATAHDLNNERRAG